MTLVSISLDFARFLPPAMTKQWKKFTFENVSLGDNNRSQTRAEMGKELKQAEEVGLRLLGKSHFAESVCHFALESSAGMFIDVFINCYRRL